MDKRVAQKGRRARHLPCRLVPERKKQKAKKGTAEAVSDWLTGPHPTRVVAVPDAKPLWERASVLSNFSFNFRLYAC